MWNVGRVECGRSLACRARALDIEQISAYNPLVRRKPGTLVPLELAICVGAADLRRRGVDEFHGYELAKTLAHAEDRRLLTAYGTLYRALGRLEQMGLLASRWEDPAIPTRENRPPRRLYSLTAAGDAALEAARHAAKAKTPVRGRRRVVPA
jgi:PadR family transcriptional regulator